MARAEARDTTPRFAPPKVEENSRRKGKLAEMEKVPGRVERMEEVEDMESEARTVSVSPRKSIGKKGHGQRQGIGKSHGEANGTVMWAALDTARRRKFGSWVACLRKPKDANVAAQKTRQWQETC